MSKLSLFIKGIAIGFASLAVPGLSASTIAIVLLVYYDMIYAISHIFSKPKKSIPFLLVLIGGYFIGALVGAVAVNTLYENFPLPVVGAVLGFLIGSIPRMVGENRKELKHVPNLLVFLIVGAVFLVYSFVVREGTPVSFEVIRFPVDYITMMCVGIITSTTLVIPGVDFAVTLMAMGYYYAFIDLVGDFAALILHPSRLFLLAFYLVGYGIGSFILSKALRYLVKRFPNQLKFVNLAFVVIAPVVVLQQCVLYNFDNIRAHSSIGQIVCFFIMFGAGMFAFWWVPILLRYFGLVPKDAANLAMKEAAAAEHGVVLPDVSTTVADPVPLEAPPSFEDDVTETANAVAASEEAPRG